MSTPYASRHRYPADPGNVGVRLIPRCPDTDRPRVCFCTNIADVDIVVSAGQQRI
jgi:hypothetical protein